MDEKPWLNREFKKGEVFSMNLSYILNHLEPSDKKYVLKEVPSDINEVDCYTASIRGDSKNWWINSFLSQEKKLEEIKLVLSPREEKFTVQDGRTRLRFYNHKGHEQISVKLYKGAN